MEHETGHGHDAGPADPHGGAPGLDPSPGHGDAEIPPAPEPRMITPAREDYVRPFPGPGLLWPMIWLVVAIGFYAAAERWKGEVIGEEHATGGHPAAGEPHEGK